MKKFMKIYMHWNIAYLSLQYYMEICICVSHERNFLEWWWGCENPRRFSLREILLIKEDNSELRMRRRGNNNRRGACTYPGVVKLRVKHEPGEWEKGEKSGMV